jgi:hypothetical protein
MIEAIQELVNEINYSEFNLSNSAEIESIKNGISKLLIMTSEDTVRSIIEKYRQEGLFQKCLLQNIDNNREDTVCTAILHILYSLANPNSDSKIRTAVISTIDSWLPLAKIEDTFNEAAWGNSRNIFESVADELHDIGNYKLFLPAILIYLTALENAAYDNDIRKYIGECYLALAEPEEAEFWFEEVIKHGNADDINYVKRRREEAESIEYGIHCQKIQKELAKDYIEQLIILNEKEFIIYGEKDLTELPNEICELSQLEKLECYKNALIELPSNIGKLSNLTSINVSYNQISELPVSLFSLIKLEYLHLGHNKLSSIPKEIENLVSLIKLNLDGNNELSSLPESIGNLKKLEELY